MKRYAIRYHSQSTVDGEPVGWVYAQDIGRLSPGCWSYTKDISEATQFTTWDEANRVRAKKHWNDSSVVEMPR